MVNRNGRGFKMVLVSLRALRGFTGKLPVTVALSPQYQQKKWRFPKKVDGKFRKIIDNVSIVMLIKIFVKSCHAYEDFIIVFHDHAKGFYMEYFSSSWQDLDKFSKYQGFHASYQTDHAFPSKFLDISWKYRKNFKSRTFCNAIHTNFSSIWYVVCFWKNVSYESCHSFHWVLVKNESPRLWHRLSQLPQFVSSFYYRNFLMSRASFSWYRFEKKLIQYRNNSQPGSIFLKDAIFV